MEIKTLFNPRRKEVIDLADEQVNELLDRINFSKECESTLSSF